MARGWITRLVHRHRGRNYGEDFNLVVVEDVSVEGISIESHAKIRNIIKKKREDIKTLDVNYDNLFF